MHSETDPAQLLAECAVTQTFEQLVTIALREAQMFKDGCHIVCGPISTGGRGTIKENLVIFSGTINALRSVPYPMFDQTPYEAQISEFRRRWIAEDTAGRSEEYYTDILTRFYLPLFESGAIVRAWFIPNWESSHGARWERETLEQREIEISDLNTLWLDDFVLGAK